MPSTLEAVPKRRPACRLKASSSAPEPLSIADARHVSLSAMTDPHLWLDGDPTGDRRIRPVSPATDPVPARTPAPPPRAPSGRGRLTAGLAGGAASAALMTAALFGFGVLDRDAAGTAAQPRAVAPSVGGARPNGDVQRIYEAAREGVVSVRAGSGTGTGFVVDRDGTLVTNAHVVGTSEEVQVQFADDETAQARVAGVDRSSDLAVLTVDTGETGPLHELELADSDGVRTGQLAVAIGSPFGLPQTATAGIVSGTGRHIQAPDGFQIDRVIQTDAPINPGNSGGPLLDARGRVIGVNSQIATGGSTSRGSVGIGFAVPSNTVADVVPRLERGETIQRPFLGVSTAPGTGGAVVREVTAGGPAADAGVRAGDVIVGVGGDRVREPGDVAAAIQDKRPGERVEVEIRRGGDSRALEVELGNRAGQTP
jgi:putative serine protease PepD